MDGYVIYYTSDGQHQLPAVTTSPLQMAHLLLLLLVD